MFCVQCEQTIRTPAGNGCSYAQGMCGKTAETSDLQDLLIASLQGLSAWALKAREYGIIDHQVDSFAPRAFFSTLTNVNFDSPRIVGYARQAIALREALKAQCLDDQRQRRGRQPGRRPAAGQRPGCRPRRCASIARHCAFSASRRAIAWRA